MIVDHHWRPLALVLSDCNDFRARGALELSHEGYDVLAFADAEDAEAWLEEDTPAVAMLPSDGTSDLGGIVEKLAQRNVLIIRNC